MDNNFQLISESELKDFENSCSRRNVNSVEFLLKEHDIIETPVGNGLINREGKLTITRNKKSRTYRIGNNSSWPSEFDIDLNQSLI